MFRRRIHKKVPEIQSRLQTVSSYAKRRQRFSGRTGRLSRAHPNVSLTIVGKIAGMSTPPTRSGERPRLLVVSPNRSHLSVLARRLSAEGYAIAVASDGAGALGELHRSPIDLVLAELVLAELGSLRRGQYRGSTSKLDAFERSLCCCCSTSHYGIRKLHVTCTCTQVTFVVPLETVSGE